MSSDVFQPSHLQRILFPDSGITKGGLIQYYQRIAPLMLAYIADRQLTLHRFPDGIGSDGFYQKAVRDHFPDWLARVTVARQGGTVTHALACDAESLGYLAHLATITFHVWLARHDRPRHPGRLIFDLDPSDNDFGMVLQAAYTIRAVLDDLALPSFVMTTGSRGLHIALPLDRCADFEQTRGSARTVAGNVVASAPDTFTLAHRKAKRGNRVYIDVLRNAYAQTGVAPYSIRARSGAPVATPLAWRELDDPRLYPQRYRLDNIFRRLGQRDCPWRDIDCHAQSLTDARRRLGCA